MPRPTAFATILFAAATALAAMLPQAAARAESPRSIIVLDASGSMWGQVDGEAKITIARRALDELLETLPPDLHLGLTAYGHRRRGDCGDIETLVEPGPDTRAAIREAVARINPVGMTPLSDAVEAAAEALRYGEEAATVILLSDGIETCDRDPCAVGQGLAQYGIDFTAHVIGFDIAAESDREQLRCLAESTGGRFLVADNAAELGEALATLTAETVAPAPTPEPDPVPEPAATTADLVFQATDGVDGPVITSGLRWSLSDLGDGRRLAQDLAIDALRLSLREGRYRVEVLRPDDEAAAAREVEVTGGADQVVTLVLESNLPEAVLTAPSSGPAGSTILVDWQGPDARNDYIAVSAPDQRDNQQVNFTYTREGSPLELRLPPTPGTYELRYVMGEGRRVIAREAITVTEVGATVAAPAAAPTGSTILVEWTGPDYRNDYIAVAAPGQRDNQQVNFTYTREGAPLELRMPPEPGTYELRYVMDQGRTVLVRAQIEVTEVEATIAAPETAPAGAVIAVEWTGPDYRNDYIAVSALDQRDNQQINFTYTRDGSPLDLLMPPQAGTYEIRYVLDQGRTILARREITVTEIGAAVMAPEAAPAGSVIQVDWKGPDYRNDYIAVAAPDQRDNQQVNYTYTRDGSPLELLMPPEPGTFEIRYVADQDRTVLARRAIEVTPVTATLGTPGSAAAGATILVEWDGPDYRNDYIAVAAPDQRDNQQVNFTYTRDGALLELVMPPEPGTYEIRYVLDQGRTVLARRTIEVTAVEAVLTAPGRAPAGSTILVDWTGPDYRNDYLAIAHTDQADNQQVTYAYTRDGTPLPLVLPDAPGTYELRYVMDQGRTVLFRAPLVVE